MGNTGFTPEKRTPELESGATWGRSSPGQQLKNMSGRCNSLNEAVESPGNPGAMLPLLEGGSNLLPASGGGAMARCEVCGNDYYLSFQVIAAGQTHTFDSFECAIHKLAPVCDHCGCKIIGHGMEAEGTFFCCAHCARESGVNAVADRA